jgi:transposase
MARPHPPELRQRVVGFVEQGHSHRETARIFQVSVRFVNNMVLLKARTGDLVASPQGGWRSSKLAGHESFVLSRIDDNGDLTLDDLRKELEERGVVVHRSSVGRLLARHKRSFKKNSSRQ